MVRAGAIAKRVIKELGELGCDSMSGECPDDLKEAAKRAFEGRSIDDYYTEGMIHKALSSETTNVKRLIQALSFPLQAKDLG